MGAGVSDQAGHGLVVAIEVPGSRIENDPGRGHQRVRRPHPQRPALLQLTSNAGEGTTAIVRLPSSQDVANAPLPGETTA